MAMCMQFYQSPLQHSASPYLQTAYYPTHITSIPSPPKANPLEVKQNVYAFAISKQKASNSTFKIEPTTPSTSISTSTTTITRPKEPKRSTQQTSLFFRLPAELRNQIYKELLCPDTLSPAQFRRHHLHATSPSGPLQPNLSIHKYNPNSTTTTTPNPTLHPQILSTCHRLHAEATPLLYTTHTFHAHPSLLTSLPYLTTPAHPLLHTPHHLLTSIRRWQLSLRLDTDPRFSAHDAAIAFSGAEYLEIRVWQAQFEACDFGVLRLFKGVRGVGIARVGGSVERGVAEWLEGRMMRGMVERGSGSDADGDVEMEVETEDCECGENGGFGIGWEEREEVLCGRCYRKIGVELTGMER
ncbi:hypothetical protein B0J11DRAFT_27095 [Dendryphion nanum]|uniref:DUF7730 domain-containing protein n=1 Tax=Dendryphion nanum TaxID=256645 RepID=A0A9P9EK01_9PLEO|nr:hypothetical protein B0J11DRAFT_27095 [Dendryphion nanum]